MKLTINELRKLVIKELMTVGGEDPAEKIASGETTEGAPIAGPMMTLQRRMVELEGKIKDINATIETLKSAQRTSKEKKGEEEAEGAAEDALGALKDLGAE